MAALGTLRGALAGYATQHRYEYADHYATTLVVFKAHHSGKVMTGTQEMNPWIRLYRGSLHNPKLVTLNDRQFRAWHNLLLVASDDGTLPSSRDIAAHLRMTIQEVEAVLCELVEACLIDVDCTNGPRKFAMHDWKTHQYVSDTSTSRVHKFRNKNNAAKAETAVKRFSNGDVTPPEPESDTETDTENKLQLPVQAAARGKSELGFNFNFKSGSEGKRGMETLLRQAEGLGLDVDEIVQITNRNAKPGKREGYFVTLCVNRLSGSLPNLNPQIIRDALNGKHEQYKTVCALLVGAT